MLGVISQEFSDVRERRDEMIQIRSKLFSTEIVLHDHFTVTSEIDKHVCLRNIGEKRLNGIFHGGEWR